MTDFTTFIAHNVLTAAELNGALNSIDAIAQGAKLAAAGAEADAQAGIAAAAGAASVAGAAQSLAAAALPADLVGVAGGVAPLGPDKLVPAAYLPAPATVSGGAGGSEFGSVPMTPPVAGTFTEWFGQRNSSEFYDSDAMTIAYNIVIYGNYATARLQPAPSGPYYVDVCFDSTCYDDENISIGVAWGLNAMGGGGCDIVGIGKAAANAADNSPAGVFSEQIQWVSWPNSVTANPVTSAFNYASGGRGLWIRFGDDGNGRFVWLSRDGGGPSGNRWLPIMYQPRASGIGVPDSIGVGAGCADYAHGQSIGSYRALETVRSWTVHQGVPPTPYGAIP